MVNLNVILPSDKVRNLSFKSPFINLTETLLTNLSVILSHPPINGDRIFKLLCPKCHLILGKYCQFLVELRLTLLSE